ncbi:hypothetical protein P4T62_30395 [Bacillus mycoides]|nr:hypothetical protein [Bacillus mycoides]EEL96087.1 hypothetical protein bmyco0001_55050 [Bacillus mycoides DSM 2048]MDR4904581.1 hypothetical protein [Bacillus mycoides]MED1042827.1 hypothetical protein [Bacillus mycoides]
MTFRLYVNDKQGVKTIELLLSFIIAIKFQLFFDSVKTSSWIDHH